ncbi:MAG TPA: carboxypeptidase-like regulatory domain-containing protein, partial [Terriglobia bacterium]|nr:carboxypeptidase-like regulatory domain-containing protein [Terriglobia bacterium]
MTSHSRHIIDFAKYASRASAALVVLWIMASVGLLCAQSDATGALGGTVTSANQPVPGATIVLTNHATNQTLTMISGENGSYRFSLLVPGTYRVSFSAPGFKTSLVSSVTVSVSEAPTLDASLEPGHPRERVECNCRLSLSASSTGTLVDHKTITGVPLTTRNFAQVLSMSSGTVADVNNA